MKIWNHFCRKYFSIAIALGALLYIVPATAAKAQRTTQTSVRMADSKIEQAVREALDQNPAFSPIDVSVLRGVVSLSGEVEHYQDKVDVEAAARSVPGVREVHDAISITTPQESDTDLQRELEDRIHYARADLGMTFPGVRIEVHDGQVILSGTVNDPIEHAVALTLAGTADGVTSVRDQIQAAPAASIDDSVRIEVNKTLYGSGLQPYDASSQIQATFRYGTVTLLGAVDTARDRDDLVSRIRGISGVTSVDDELLVKNTQPVLNETSLNMPGESGCTKN